MQIPILDKGNKAKMVVAWQKEPSKIHEFEKAFSKFLLGLAADLKKSKMK